MHAMPMSAPIENFLPRAARIESESARFNRTLQAELDGIGTELDAGRARARADQQQFGETGTYAVATLYHVMYLDQARDQLADIREWLRDHGAAGETFRQHGAMHPTLTPYQLCTHLREMAAALQYARHWAMVSAAYHHSGAAGEAFEHITRALQKVEGLNERAGRAFLEESKK